MIVGRGFREKHRENRKFLYDTASDLIESLEAEETSVTKHYVIKSRLNKARRKGRSWQNQRLLGELMDVRLGGVTGDARYFLLNESQRTKMELPTECLRPVLSRARHLVASEMTESLWQGLCDAGERVWLFHAAHKHLDHPAVRRYMELKEGEGGCRRTMYKVRSRELWYRVRLPEAVDGFLSGMTQHGPWLCFSRMPRLSATNTLYTFRFKEELSDDEKVAWALALREAVEAGTSRIIGRKYADGLVKYEPGDLYKIPLKGPERIEDVRVRYRVSIEKMLTHSALKMGKTCDEVLD